MKRLWIVLLLAALPLAAEESRNGSDPAQEEVTVEDVPQIEGDALKLFLEKIEVLGRLEKPQAVFIIPGGDPEIDDVQIKRSFFDEIFRPVEKVTTSPTAASLKTKKKRRDVIPW